MICLGFSIESIRKLEQRFDPTWFIPQNTHLADYLKVRKIYYPTNGFEAGIYMGSINYTYEIMNIKNMVDHLNYENESVLDVISWVDPFRDYVKINFISGKLNIF